MAEYLAMTVIGAFLFWLGIHGLRTRAYNDCISPIEAVILKVTGEEPLPINEADRAWGRLSAWVAVVSGLFLFLLGALVVALSLFEPESV